MREKWTCSAIGTYIRKVCVLACWISCWLQSAIVFFSSKVLLLYSFLQTLLVITEILHWDIYLNTSDSTLIHRCVDCYWCADDTQLWTLLATICYKIVYTYTGKPWKWSTLVTKSCSVSIYNLEGIVSF